MRNASLQRVLYVEDEPDIQMIARLALETIGGFTVMMCDSGSQALEVASTWKPDLILLDVMMPDMDGPSTFKKLQTMPEVASVPVVFMTAKVQPQEIEAYRSMGALDVVAKPFDPMRLAEKIRTIWATRETDSSE